MTETAAPTAAVLAAKLPELTAADQHRLGRRLAGIRRIKDSERRAAALADLAGQVSRAESRIARRRSSIGTITFPDELPVSARVDDLMAAIETNQVVIVAGETGSGKSTQLPKICLKLGRGVRGLIGHTQPRRIAARSLAERIAEETGTELGGLVGYTIRFGDHTGPDTMVKLMTDGILLAEITRDRELSRYDTIILDEAHERSLNIDFLLGYLTELLPRRPDLKVIITSATIDPLRFSRHFGGAPIVEVSGRTYPVEVRYRPYGPAEGADEAEPDAGESVRPAGRRASPDESVDQATAICRAVDELAAEGDGDVLVFLSGEREITDTAEVLRGHLAGSSGSGHRVEVLPLYGRLSIADQHRVFSPHSGRRIVLSTNVAETSLTVPGIRYVIDPGTARISRYSTRTKVQRLPIEKISQASAGQRAGRCGRVADGICIRLYAEQDFLARPEFTDPEIARTSLASVILQMASLGLGDVASFPFVEPPDPRQISDGITVLEELGALDRRTGSGPVTLTETGRALAALPLDPRLARMIVEADRLGCLREVLVITAALAIQDVREYPLDDREKATAAHSRFVDPHSDFMALLNLWQYLGDQGKTLSGNAFRRMCKREYLHYLRIREWQDLHGQLRSDRRRVGYAPGPRRTGGAAGAARRPAVRVRSGAGGRVRRRSPPPPIGPPRSATRLPRHQPRRRRRTVDRRRDAAGQGIAGGLGGRRARAHRAARRAALARRAETRTRPGVPGHQGDDLRHLARVRAGQGTAAIRDGRRAGGDIPAVGTAGRAHRPGLGGEGGRTPGAPQPLRTAVGGRPRVGGGHRTGNSARRHAGGRAHRPVRPDRPGTVP